MSATIDDVAKKAAVSTATVSRALRGLPNVAPKTRKHILSVAKELNYAINPQASRALSGRKVVALITPLLDQWFYSKLSTVVALELLAKGLDNVRYSADSIQTQTALIDMLLQQTLMDACIVVSFPLEEEAQRALKLHNVPAFTIETKTSQFPSVYIDNVAAGELATRHLINLGHKRIGLISGTKGLTAKDLIPSARQKGYRRALKQAGLKADKELEHSGHDVYRGGAEAMKKLLLIQEPPTAVFAASDEMALGALKTIRDFNLRVPEDISVIGFDDNDMSEFLGLTTIRQPVARYGELATENVHSQLESGELIKNATELSFELIIRLTTGPVKLHT